MQKPKLIEKKYLFKKEKTQMKHYAFLIPSILSFALLAACGDDDSNFAPRDTDDSSSSICDDCDDESSSSEKGTLPRRPDWPCPLRRKQRTHLHPRRIPRQVGLALALEQFRGFQFFCRLRRRLLQAPQSRGLPNRIRRQLRIRRTHGRARRQDVQDGENRRPGMDGRRPQVRRQRQVHLGRGNVRLPCRLAPSLFLRTRKANSHYDRRLRIYQQRILRTGIAPLHEPRAQ